MVRSLALALVALSFGVPSAIANGPLGALLVVTSEVRLEMAVLDAQANATLPNCPDRRDIQRELGDLCRDLDRLERLLRQPVRNESDAQRVARYAQRVDGEACDLQDDVDDAVRRLSRRARGVSVVGPSTLGPVEPYRFRQGAAAFTQPHRRSPQQVSTARARGAVPLVSLYELRARADRIRAITSELAYVLGG